MLVIKKNANKLKKFTIVRILSSMEREKKSVISPFSLAMALKKRKYCKFHRFSDSKMSRKLQAMGFFFS